MRTQTQVSLSYASQSIKEAGASLKIARRRLTGNREMISKIVKALKPLAVSVSTLYGARMTATMDGLEGFKDQRLCDTLGRLLDLGPTEDSTADFPDYMNRDFKFTFAGVLGNIELTLCAYVSTDSPTCRKVLTQVSTQVVEHKTYELVCD
jgi:hypothetical protein